MKTFALVGNPNCGKTTLFNSLTGSTAYVGNWPGVTVDKKEGTYKKCVEPVSIVDLPGIYSLSPYTPEEVISRNYILDGNIDGIINIVDATNLERNLYLTTQLLEMDVPVVIALNLMDVLKKNNETIEINKLSDALGVPVIEISALKEDNLDSLMNVAYETSKKKRIGHMVLNNCSAERIIHLIAKEYQANAISSPLFHAIKLIENDEIETSLQKGLLPTMNKYKSEFNDSNFGNDFEAIIADARYRFITDNCTKLKTSSLAKETKSKNPSKSDKIDKVLTNKWVGIPIFFLILFIIFHLTFSENLFFLGKIFESNGIAPSFEGSAFEGLFWTNSGINSPGVMLFNLIESITTLITDSIANLLPEGTWYTGLIVEGILGGLSAVISFIPQILVLFLFFSILEDSGYMSRIAFILDKIFRKFGLSGRSFMPMIMGFGCSVPAMINTRTLADENERTATIRVIPFFSCGAKLPILIAISGGIVQWFNIGNADLITYAMYILGMVTAVISVLLMRKTTMKGEVPPFIMELPDYHLPQFKSLMLHLWDKLKHFLKKAFTIILASTIVIWFLSNFSWTFWNGLVEMDNSIIASIGKFIQPIFTPLGFGSQLQIAGWAFVVAAITGLLAKENVVATLGTIAACLVAGFEVNESLEGVDSVVQMIQITGITFPALLAFIAFNMTTIPCLAACATAKAELPKGKFWTTVIFWIFTSYIVGTIVYTVLSWWWTIFLWISLALVLGICIHFFNKRKELKK